MAIEERSRPVAATEERSYPKAADRDLNRLHVLFSLTMASVRPPCGEICDAFNDLERTIHLWRRPRKINWLLPFEQLVLDQKRNIHNENCEASLYSQITRAADLLQGFGKSYNDIHYYEVWCCWRFTKKGFLKMSVGDVFNS